MNTTTQPSIGVQRGSTALEVGHLSALTKCKMLSLLGTNMGPAQFIQVHDALSAPANGAVPLYSFPVATNQYFAIDTPIQVVTGLYVCNSTTMATKTAGAADCWFLTRHL